MHMHHYPREYGAGKSEWWRSGYGEGGAQPFMIESGGDLLLFQQGGNREKPPMDSIMNG